MGSLDRWALLGVQSQHERGKRHNLPLSVLCQLTAGGERDYITRESAREKCEGSQRVKVRRSVKPPPEWNREVNNAFFHYGFLSDDGTFFFFSWLPWHSFCNSSNMKRSCKHFQKYAAQFPLRMSGERDTCTEGKKSLNMFDKMNLKSTFLTESWCSHQIYKHKSFRSWLILEWSSATSAQFTDSYEAVKRFIQSAPASKLSIFAREVWKRKKKKTDSSNPVHCSCYSESKTSSFATKLSYPPFPSCLHHSEKRCSSLIQ